MTDTEEKSEPQEKEEATDEAQEPEKKEPEKEEPKKDEPKKTTKPAAKDKPKPKKAFRRSGLPQGTFDVLIGVVLLGVSVGYYFYTHGQTIWYGAMLVGGFEILYGGYRIARNR